ncbi:hypothetical protein SEVIR_3G419800v4 [Setaria viridis]|uniref:Uncharacterized protein n=1 Tax=Setaria viridis TaxID=4556 RepID=A0A4U6VPX4_SETVI|nr:hypothetical protein SEVIR_3G419800v2 [Setaria viridis]
MCLLQEQQTCSLQILSSPGRVFLATFRPQETRSVCIFLPRSRSLPCRQLLFCHARTESSDSLAITSFLPVSQSNELANHHRIDADAPDLLTPLLSTQVYGKEELHLKHCIGGDQDNMDLKLERVRQVSNMDVRLKSLPGASARCRASLRWPSGVFMGS